MNPNPNDFFLKKYDFSEYAQDQTSEDQDEAGYSGDGHFFFEDQYARQCADRQTQLTECLN